MKPGPVRVELHCHSNLSDGTVSPEALATEMARSGVSFASLTDHDTVEGCQRFRDALAGTGVACIDGAEITTSARGFEVHLLGYGIDPHHEGLRAALSANRLKVDPGLPGLVDSMKRMGSRARRGDGAPMDTVEAIALVHAAGGRAFVAHPLSGPLGYEALEELLPSLQAAGLDGIEAVYGPYGETDRQRLAELAARHGLVVSGGSDFHGPEQAAGPEPGVELTAAQWRRFRDLLLPGHVRRAPPRPAHEAGALGSGRFALRIVVPAAAAVVLFVVALFAIDIPGFESVLLERKKDTIRDLTDSAVSILREYAADERAGRLSADEARRGAAARVRDLRYGKDGKDYFWITDMRPVMIVHPYRPELEGTDVSEYRDANGVQVFVEFVNAVRDRNQGYVEYLWQWKDDAHRIVPKLSFVERFPDWDWVVGTGIYLDDVHAEIVRLARWMIWLSAGITGALALILAFVINQSLAVERARRAAEARLHESHERYRSLVEASSESMVLLVGGALTYANPSFLDLTGYTANQLPLLGIGELLRAHEGEEADLAKFLAALVPDAATETRPPLPLACRLVRRGGQPVDAVLTASPFVVAGRHGWILAVRPVSPRRTGPGPLAADEASPVGAFRSTWGHDASLVDANGAARRALARAGDPDGLELLARLRPIVRETNRVTRYEIAIGASRRSARILLVSATLGPVLGDGERYLDGVLEDVTAIRAADALFDDILGMLCDAAAPADVGAAWAMLPRLVASLLEAGAGLEAANRRVTRAGDIALGLLVRLAVAELGPPPVPFAFLVLGSEGRQEATALSDQDNAIVFADGGDEAAARAWFAGLGGRVCGWLEAAGVPRCRGGMVAANPRWCASLSEWKAMFGHWIAEPEPQELLDFQVFFDFRSVHGDRSLPDDLRAFIGAELAREPPFFPHLARDLRDRRVPGLLGAGGAGIDASETACKEAAMPFVGFARLYALRHGVAETNTLARLSTLRDRGVLKPDLHRQIVEAYRFLAEARLARQVAASSGGPPPELIDPVRLRSAAECASLLAKRIGFDFLGAAL